MVDLIEELNQVFSTKKFAKVIVLKKFSNIINRNIETINSFLIKNKFKNNIIYLFFKKENYITNGVLEDH